jgi:hypothetical protein
MIGIFASKIFHQKAPKNDLLEDLTEKNMDLLVNKLKSLFAKTDLSVLNSAKKIEAIKKYYNFSEKQLKTILDGLESNNSEVLDSLTNLLYSFETDIDGVSKDIAIFPGPLLDVIEFSHWDENSIKENEQLALYKDVIDDIDSCLKKNEKNAATIKLIHHLLPKVKHLMVEYISNMIQSIASDADSFEGKEKEIVSQYFPQSLTTKSLGEIQDVINEKFDYVLTKFSKESYNKTPYGFAICFFEARSGINHNNTQYSHIDKILARHDEKIKAKIPENEDHAVIFEGNDIDSLLGEDICVEQ